MRPDAIELIELEDLKLDLETEEKGISKNKLSTNSATGMRIFRQYVNSTGGHDEVGLARTYLLSLIKCGYPWIATKTTFQICSNIMAHLD